MNVDTFGEHFKIDHQNQWSSPLPDRDDKRDGYYKQVCTVVKAGPL